MGVGIDAAMNWFDSNINQDCPLFSVYSGSNILFSYCKMDLDESRSHFENNINALIENGFNDILTLKSHLLESNKKPILFITNKLPTTSSFFWRPVELNRPFFDNSTSEYKSNGSETLHSKMARLEEKIEARFLKEDEDDEDVENDENIAGINPQNNIFAFLNTLIQNEQIQNAIVGKILSLVSPPTPKIAGIQSIQNNNIQPMQNVTEEEAQICLQSISILKQVKPDIVKDLQTLANIAQTDQAKCNFILSMLPK